MDILVHTPLRNHVHLEMRPSNHENWECILIKEKIQLVLLGLASQKAALLAFYSFMQTQLITIVFNNVKLRVQL